MTKQTPEYAIRHLTGASEHCLHIADNVVRNDKRSLRHQVSAPRNRRLERLLWAFNGFMAVVVWEVWRVYK